MGQYFNVVNLTKKELISPYDFDNGAKIMEHSWIGNEYVGVVLELLKPEKSWYKNKIVWSSDYMDEEEFLSEQCEFGETPPKDLVFSHYYYKGEAYHTLFSFANQYFTKIKPAKKKRYSYKTYKYLLNHDTKQYVNLDTLPAKKHTENYNGTKKVYKFSVNPLPLLTAAGHGRGGGCYYSEVGQEFIGTWSGNSISLEKQLPKGFTEIKPDFIE